ncbi:CYTH domain-containing protein [Listeria sp. PSOL-1]|uniref:CYTH domain-containing protein n=1 Tax=Listeria sp. PSOL-1 TaxID=1844999 RepID=UPI0013CF9D82|nr:CYTH domain-containing protein [Listeria sp. PSOL-1]
MSQELEIEFRNMLTASEYEKLTTDFNIKADDYFEQINYYFDTPAFALKNRQSALRIRKIKNNDQLTLKTPEGNGLLETTQILGADQTDAILKGANIPIGKVREQLAKLSVSYEDLILFGSLKTIRSEIEYKKGLLVFDKNFYGNVVDYNLEYEVPDYEKGKSIFSELLENYSITEIPAPNKIERFYTEVYHNE